MLVILGLVVLVLFVPIFYRGEVYYSDDCTRFHFRAHWLLFPVRLKYLYEDGEQEKTLRIFGFNILREKKRDKYETPLAEFTFESAQEGYGDTGEDDDILIDLIDDVEDYDERDMLDPKVTYIEYPDVDIPEMSDIDTGIKESRISKIKKRFKRDEDEFRKPFKEKVVDTAANVKSKIIDNVSKGLKVAETAMRKIEAVISRTIEIIEFIHKKSTRKAFKKTVAIFKKVSKHLFPKRILGKIEFGCSEPHLTGQALGGIAIAYDMFRIDPEDVEVIPHFEKEMIDAKLEYKGRVLVAVLGYYFIKFYLDPDIKKTLKFFNK